MTATLREWRVRTPAANHTQVSRERWWLDLGIVVPALAAVAYVTVLVIRLTSDLSSFYWYSDFPETLRLGDAVFHHGYGQGLSVPAQTGIGPLWVVGMLDQVTGNDIVGMTVGALMVVLAVGLMAWTAYRVIGRLGAVVVGVLCVAAPPVVAWEMLTPVAHESTVLLAAIGAWQLVSLSQPARGRAIASSALVGAVAGVCVISDALAVPAAVAPWIVCAILLVRRNHSKGLPIVITAGAAIASAAAVVFLATGSGIVARGGVGLALSMNGVSAGLHSVTTTLGQMISGAWYAEGIPAALAVAGLVSFVAVLLMATRAVRQHATGSVPGRDVYVWFWSLACAGLIAAYCISGLGIQHSPIDYQGHYVDELWFAIAALLPLGFLWLGSIRRILLVACAASLAVVSTVGVAAAPAYLFNGPDYVDTARLTSTLVSLGARRGYGGYWESYAVGWHTDTRITALPLQQCASGLCRYAFAAPAWYQRQPGPVFVIVQASACSHDTLCIDASNLEGLPPPESVHAVGLLRVYIYAQDVFAGLPMATGL
ncbi:MAG: hypothetical protein ACHQ4F_14895 [Candidatus Dormibacteria bacterium]